MGAVGAVAFSKKLRNFLVSGSRSALTLAFNFSPYKILVM